MVTKKSKGEKNKDIRGTAKGYTLNIARINCNIKQLKHKEIAERRKNRSFLNCAQKLRNMYKSPMPIKKREGTLIHHGLSAKRRETKLFMPLPKLLKKC